MCDSENIQLNIGICDDEAHMVSMLKQQCLNCLQDRFTLHVDTACSSQELLSMERPFHIALLDVQLVESSGIELARKILERNHRCRIIFVSGHLHAVSEVYDVPHFCFILKEHMEEQLPRFLQRAAELAAQEAGRRIMISCGRHMEEVVLADITMLERKGHVTFVRRLSGAPLQTKEKLQELLQRIGDGDFIRCHVSFVVNLKNTQELKGSSFLMSTGEVVPISRPNEGACRDAFFRHLGENME